MTLSLGECFWSPRWYDYSMSLAPYGREGIFTALASAPLFAAKLPTGEGRQQCTDLLQVHRPPSVLVLYLQGLKQSGDACALSTASQAGTRVTLRASAVLRPVKQDTLCRWQTGRHVVAHQTSWHLAHWG